MHRHADAIRCFEKAAALLESDYVAAAMLIQNYEALGDSEGAKRAARRALQRIEKIVALEPDHGTALGHGVGVLAILGEADRARDWAERAMILDPENRTLRYNLACAMVKLADYERALDYLESALKQSHEQALVWAQEDTDLNPLRKLPRYEAIMAAAAARVAADRHD
jgi:adenylate cyclase